MFECASVNAAQALANFSNSTAGVRKGKKAGMAKFKSRHKSTPSFKLRSKSKPGAAAPLRVTGPKTLRLPTIGDVRVHGNTKLVRRMLESGRLHLTGAAVTFEQGRWWVSLQGKAGEFNRQRRAPAGRHPRPAGLDVGIKALAVLADTEGTLLRVVAGVNTLQQAQAALRRANKTLSRTKKGSAGRRQARERLVKVHARIANRRKAVAHDLSYYLATSLTRLTIEDLNVAGMVQLRPLARALSDAGLGGLGTLIGYKARWYGCELVLADRWFASSKTCSGCGARKSELTLAERTYACESCGLVLDRDVNAAVNLARWPDRSQGAPPQEAPPPQEAA